MELRADPRPPTLQKRTVPAAIAEPPIIDDEVKRRISEKESSPPSSQRGRKSPLVNKGYRIKKAVVTPAWVKGGRILARRDALAKKGTLEDGRTQDLSKKANANISR